MACIPAAPWKLLSQRILAGNTLINKSKKNIFATNDIVDPASYIFLNYCFPLYSFTLIVLLPFLKPLILSLLINLFLPSSHLKCWCLPKDSVLCPLHFCFYLLSLGDFNNYHGFTSSLYNMTSMCCHYPQSLL